MTQSRSPALDYRSLGQKIALAIASVAFVPYALIFIVFYYSYNQSIHAKVIDSLKNVAEAHKQTIDNFLDSRLANLTNAANLSGLSQLTDPQGLKNTLASLQEVYGVFVDLELVNSDGRSLTYAGAGQPENLDYNQTAWFKEAMTKGRYLSDVFEKAPAGTSFFFLALRLGREKEYVLKAVIEAAPLDMVVASINFGQTGQAILVNRQGIHQTHSRQERRFGTMESPAPELFSGVKVSQIKDINGRELVQAQVWVNHQRWMLICRQDANDAYSALYQVRLIALAVGAAGGLMVIGATLFFTRRLVNRWAEADRQKELLHEQIIQADKLSSLGMMVTGVAHDINNPLAIMLEEAGWLQDLMLETPLLIGDDAARAEFENGLNKIKSHGRRCKEITQMLLNFARKTDATNRRPTQINDLARGVVGLVERLARSARVNLVLDLDQELPKLNIAPTELEQVLMNLVKNAVDAMEQTGGEIIIRTGRVEPDEIEIIVQDNGPGIPAVVRDRIFDPFFTTKPVGKGTGLGLSICHDIIEKLGGKIELRNNQECGAIFVVHLPMSLTAG
ncbi:MAG: two-component sensor histidine kinase [Deltaproteobacteria bacterium]|nr:two-component sensor histidine kinase [Deltaproteobacteria bacterium]